MIRYGRSRAVGALLLLGGCSYHSMPQAPPPASALTAPARRVPGAWVVQLETDRLTRQAGLSGSLGCSAATYSVDAGAAFGEAVRTALALAFERTVPSGGGSSASELRRARASGVIIVQAAQFEPRADIERRSFGATVRATTALAANVAVDRASRRAFEGTIEASGDAAVPIGMMFDCGAVREALGEATGRAVQQLAARISERLAQTPGIRPVPAARRPPPAQPGPPQGPAPPAAPAAPTSPPAAVPVS